MQVSASSQGSHSFTDICVIGATCEEGGMADIPYGEATQEEGGAVYR